MFHYLYQITNLVNNKIYVGVHKTIDINDGYMGSGKVIKHAIEKYGINNFKKDILETFDNSESMYAREKEVVTEEFLSRNDVYNLRRGGNGGFDYINANPDKYLTEKRLNSLMSQEDLVKRWKEKYNSDENFRKLNSEKLKRANKICRINNPNGTFYGKEHSKETKNKMSESHYGKHDGNKNSQFGTMWICNLETKENRKISNRSIPNGWVAGRNKWNVNATRPKKSIKEKVSKKYLNGYKVLVNGITYDSISKAADSLGIGHETARMRFKSSSFPSYIILCRIRKIVI
jgi:group I intron endonuclease